MRRTILGVLAALAIVPLLGGCSSQTAVTEKEVAAQAAPAQPDLSAQTAPTPPQASVGTREGPIFYWKTVGGDSCNPQAGCTLEYALRHTSWPSEVKAAFPGVVRDRAGTVTTIVPGWEGWMTWGYYSPKFHPRTRAAFSQTEEALEWTYVHQGTEYVLVRVKKCRNWGGYTRVPTPPTPRRPALPTVACP